MQIEANLLISLGYATKIVPAVDDIIRVQNFENSPVVVNPYVYEKEGMEQLTVLTNWVLSNLMGFWSESHDKDFEPTGSFDEIEEAFFYDQARRIKYCIDRLG